MEKKHIVFDLQLSYKGPLSVEGFYQEVDRWISENGLEKEIKIKSEDITSKGKKIEWTVEAWKEATHLVKQTVRLRVLFNNVREIKVKRKGNNIKTDNAEVLAVIDGFVETKLNKQWTMNPLYFFFRTLYDKYIWGIGQTETEKYEGAVYDYCYDLHKRLKAIFHLDKMRVA
jgi:hypothetical protein